MPSGHKRRSAKIGRKTAVRGSNGRAAINTWQEATADAITEFAIRSILGGAPATERASDLERQIEALISETKAAPSSEKTVRARFRGGCGGNLAETDHSFELESGETLRLRLPVEDAIMLAVAIVGGIQRSLRHSQSSKSSGTPKRAAFTPWGMGQ